MTASPVVSIFIRTYNEEKLLGECLSKVFQQVGCPKFEVIVLDCESSDRTVSIAKQFQCRIFSIPKAAFTYSSALNLGVDIARGNFFVPLSGHAVPVNEHWLAKLVAPVQNRSGTTASFSRQIAWPDAAPTIKFNMLREFPETPEAIGTKLQSMNFKVESDFYRSCLFSNVSSCIPSAFLRSHPFREIPLAEDRAFALDLIANGGGVAYAHESLVYHSHRPSLRDYARVARRGSAARFYLNQLARSLFPEARIPPYQLRAGHQALKFLPLLLYVTVKVGTNSQGRDEARHHFAELGTLWGKWQAARDIRKLPDLPLPPADISQLRQIVRLIDEKTE